jgi:hypothetical protein
MTTAFACKRGTAADVAAMPDDRPADVRTIVATRVA